MSSVSAIILAAGLGTRMKSKLPKVLHKAGGAYLVEHAIGAAGSVAPMERITAVVGYQAERVKEAIAHLGIQFQEQTEQLGTGHAVLACKDLAHHQDGRVIVLYGDSPLLRAETIQGLLETHIREGCEGTLITTFMDNPYGYGRIVRDSDGRVIQIIEEKACTPEQKLMREVNPGIYCFEAKHLWAQLQRLTPNPAANEYYLTDIVELFREAGLKMAAHPVEDPAEILGINTRVELAQADRILRDRKTTALMLAGVTIEKPESVTIDMGVTVGMDTVIGPFAQLLGNTTVGQGCRIGASTILENATLGDDVEVLPFTSVVDSHLGDEAHAGPYARIRMGSHVEAGAHVGNFVELKKTHLGAGAKSMHLAYLGDASIGANVNIGAGTITCNYDGKKKNPTVIGKDSFVGSNSTLVAPVEIGAGSYIAAGSVITKSVPPDALALGRAQQVVKDDWAKKRREEA